MNIRPFDKNKLNYIPPILQDFALQLQNLNNTPEVRENYAQKFEIIKEYCDYIADIHKQMKKETYSKKRTKVPA